MRAAGLPTLCDSGCTLVLTQPSQGESEAMGLRDWPPTVQREAFDDACQDGAQRYVLEGSGSVACAGKSFAVSPNTLVRVVGDGELRWSLNEGVDEIVLLTPEYRGPPLLPIAAGFLVASIALIAVSSGGG